MVSRETPPAAANGAPHFEGKPGVPQLPPGIAVAAVRAHLERILGSDHFYNSERLSRFLRFAVEQVLLGGENKLKEYLIGVEVFDRQESFDPRIDSIVRVEARRLRSKLDQYYETEGREDAIQIQFRKGSYVPAIRSRQSQPARRRGDRPVAGELRDWRAIAVLPFESLSQDPANQLFADGLTQEIMAALTRVKSLRVAARTTSFQFRERYPDIRRIGEELRVDALLTGSVRREGERARITAHLIHVEEGYYLWSDSYDCEIRDAFACQEEIAGKVLVAVRRKLAAGAEDAGMEKLPVVEPAEASVAAAVVFEALLGLVASDEARQRVRAMSDRVAAASPGSPNAYTVAGLVQAIEWKWDEAEAAFTRAIELDPDDGLARGAYGVYLTCRGRLEDGLVELRLAEELAPPTALIRTAIGHTLYLRRNLERAMEQFQRALVLNPAYVPALCGLANAYLLKEMCAEAIDAGRRAMERPTLARVLVLGGERAEGERLVEAILAEEARRVAPAARMAAVYASLGDPERALARLNEAAAGRSLELLWLPWDPAFDSLRGDARFARFLGG